MELVCSYKYKIMRYIFSFVELDVLPFNYETETGDDDIPTLNDILAASFVNVRFNATPNECRYCPT